MDSTTIPTPSPPPILKLPTELRFNIYGYLVHFKAPMVVYSGHQIVKEADIQTLRLMHVNQIIRTEVQELVYRRQSFEFRSFPAADKFLQRIGSYHASLITNITLSNWLCRRMSEQLFTSLLRRLPSLQYFQLKVAPCHGYLYPASELQSGNYRAEQYMKAILRASPSLTAGRAWAGNNHHEVCFTPKDVVLPAFDTAQRGFYHGGYTEIRIPQKYKLEHEARVKEEDEVRTAWEEAKKRKSGDAPIDGDLATATGFKCQKLLHDTLEEK